MTVTVNEATFHVGELWTGRRNSRDTTGEECELFCNSCFNLWYTIRGRNRDRDRDREGLWTKRFLAYVKQDLPVLGAIPVQIVPLDNKT